MLIAVSSCSVVPKDFSLKATIKVQTISNTEVGHVGGMKFTIHNTGAGIGKLQIFFLTDYGSDNWSKHHMITDSGSCTLQDTGDFLCGALRSGDTQTFTIEGTADEAGTFHYEVGFADASGGQPAYINFSSKGIKGYSFDEHVLPANEVRM